MEGERSGQEFRLGFRPGGDEVGLMWGQGVPAWASLMWQPHPDMSGSAHIRPT